MLVGEEHRTGILACPGCHGSVEERVCAKCRHRVPTLDGIPIFSFGSPVQKIRRLHRDAIFARHVHDSPRELIARLWDEERRRPTPPEVRSSIRFVEPAETWGGARLGDWPYLCPRLPSGATLVVESGWGDAALSLKAHRRVSVWAGFAHPDTACLAARRFRDAQFEARAFLFDPTSGIPLRDRSVALAVVRRPTAIFSSFDRFIRALANATAPGGMLYIEEENRHSLRAFRDLRRRWTPRSCGRVLKRRGFRVVARLARLPDLDDPRVGFRLEDASALRRFLDDAPPGGPWEKGTRGVERWMARAGGYAAVVPAFGILAQREGHRC